MNIDKLYIAHRVSTALWDEVATEGVDWDETKAVYRAAEWADDTLVAACRAYQAERGYMLNL